MYIIDQDIANKIAMGPMKYWLMKILFEASDEEADKIESMIWNENEHRYNYNTARAICTSLPLLLEHTAISKYIKRVKKYELRMALPEILSPREGAYLAQGDIMYMSKEDIDQTIEALSNYQKNLSKLTSKNTLQLSIPFGIEKKVFEMIHKKKCCKFLMKQ